MRDKVTYQVLTRVEGSFGPDSFSFSAYGPAKAVYRRAIEEGAFDEVELNTWETSEGDVLFCSETRTWRPHTGEEIWTIPEEERPAA